MLHLSLPTSDLIVESTCSGKGIHFRLDEGSTFDDLPNGSILTGSVFASGMSVIDHVTVTDGIFIICAINTILGIRCPDEHEHFLTFVEKEFMGISRSCHTVYTSQFKKALNRKTGGKKKASRDNLEDDLSLISDGMSNHSN